MRGYLSYFKVIMLTNLQYKTAALAGIATQFFWGFLQIFIYEAFYSGQANDAPISYGNLVTYVWLQQAFFALIFIRYKDREFIDSIKNGSVAYELLRPYNMYTWWYVKCMARKLAAVSLRFMPIILFAIFLPAPYNLAAPASIWSFLMFILALFLGMFVLVGINLIMQMISFFTYDDKGITTIIGTLAELLSGLTLPIPLLPLIIQKISFLLPFRLIGDLPFRVYSLDIPLKEAFGYVGLQLVWIVILISCGVLILKKATKKLYIQGG